MLLKTLKTAAPELLESKGYGKEIDIWSLGVLLFTALATSTPFPQGLLKQQRASPCCMLNTNVPITVGDDGKEEDRQRLREQIKTGKLDYSLPVWEEISDDGNKMCLPLYQTTRLTLKDSLAKDLINNMIMVDKTKRFNIQQVTVSTACLCMCSNANLLVVDVGTQMAENN